MKTDTLQALASCAAIDRMRIVNDRTISIETKNGLDLIAKHLSIRSNEGYAMLGSRVITHMLGPKSVRIVLEEDVEDIERAIALAEKYTGEKQPYSSSACSRAMLSRFYSKIGSYGTFGNGAKIIESTGWHCLRAIPGEYEEARLIDLSGAYWQMLNKSISPFINVIGDKIEFVRLRSKDEQAWREFLQEISKHKTIRNSLVGSWASEKCRKYVKGEYRESSVPMSKLISFARLIVASTYEITSEACKETNAIYSHTDSVAFQGAPPQLWSDLGLTWSEKGHGSASILATGARRIGEDASLPWLAQHGPLTGKQTHNVIFKPKKIDTTASFKGLHWARWLMR